MSSSSKVKTDAVKRKLFQYSPHKVGLALDAIRNGMKVSTASKNYNVPRTTLRHKLSGDAPETSGHVGPQAVLGIEIENELVEWIKVCARDGFPVDKEGLLDSVKKIVEKGNLKTPFINNRPSRSWFEGFMARHPDVRQKHAEYINKARALITEEKIRSWFQEVSSILGPEHLKVLEDPSRVWNCDETAFFLAPKGCLVLAEKGKHVYDTSKNSDKDNITTLFTVNALGEYAPPLTVYKYKRISRDVYQNSPHGWGVGKTDKGWMTGEAFYEYVGNVFLPYLKEKEVKLPIILFLDGHKSHLTMQLSKLCRENGIIVVALVPNTTHMLQPLDVAVFYPLKQNWRKLVKKWRIEHDGQEITKFNLPSALYSLLIHNETFANNVKAGFKTCGLFPFGADFVNYKRIVKSHSDTRENHNVVTKPTISESSYLTYLESKIDPNLIKVFYTTFESGKDWEGNKEASMLYDTWLAFKNDNSATMTRTNQAVMSEVIEDSDTDTGENGEKTAHQENICSQDDPPEERCLSASLLDTLNLDDTVKGTGTQCKDNSCNKEDLGFKDASAFEEPSASSSRFVEERCTSASHLDTRNPDDAVKGTGTQSEDNSCNKEVPAFKDVSAVEEPSASSSRLSTRDQEGTVKRTSTQHKHNSCNVEDPTPKDDNTLEEPCVSSTHLVTCDQVNSALCTPEQKKNQDEYKSNEDPPCITSEHLDTCNQMDATIQNEEAKKISKKSVTYTARELVRQCVLYPGKEVPKKTRKAIYIPSVITSDKWRDIMEAAENEKKKIQVNKQKKHNMKTNNKKKKVSKEICSSDEDGEVIEADNEEDGLVIEAAEIKKKKKEINKKKKQMKMKAKKKKVPKEISSSEEDGEVEYVESDESVWNEQSDANSNDEEMIDQGTKLYNQLKKGSGQRKRKRPATEDSSSESESELPLSHVANSSSENKNKNLKTGCYVIIKYEGEYFPGKIEKKEGGLYEISTMVLSTGNTFRWPERPDKIWYTIREIVEIINPPVKHNNRGFFKIVEMEKFLPNIYNI